MQTYWFSEIQEWRNVDSGKDKNKQPEGSEGTGCLKYAQVKNIH